VPSPNVISYCYADYLQWPLEERVELIDGVKFEMGVADAKHDVLINYLHEILYDFLRSYSGKATSQPFDLRIPNGDNTDKSITTVLQPDICVVCNPSILDERGCIGAPDIVFAILTADNCAVTLKEKYHIYETAGVKEYWIFSTNEHWCQVYTLTNGKYIPSKLFVNGEVVYSKVLPNFELHLTPLFNSLSL